MLRRRAVQLLTQGLRACARQGARDTTAARGGEASLAKDAGWQQVRRQWSDRRGYEHFDGRGRFLSGGGYSSQRSYVFLATAGGIGFVVWVSSRQEVPYTGRKHAILVSCALEQALGREAYQQVLAEARAQGALLPPYHPAVQAVKRVGQRIARAATDGFGAGFQDHMKATDWEFTVIRSPQVNAFVVPGGKVVVYTGLLQLMKSEDELAAVLAHECAHVLARHGAERMSQAQFLQVARLLTYWTLGIDIPSGLLTAAFFLPNSRKAETEADIIGVQLAARACYDPGAAVAVFEKLEAVEQKMGGGAVPKFLRTHPVSSDRIKRIEQMLPRADYLYENSGCEVARGPLHGFRGALARVVHWGTPPED